MDPIKTIGTILTGDEARDAIHIAVLPVVCGEERGLQPGEAVTLAHGTSDVAIRARDDYGLMRSIGIVDPFIALHQDADKSGNVRWNVKKGERFWLFLHPNSVTGMRHHWQHPAVDRPAEVRSDAEAWLHRFAEKWGFDYETLIRVADNPTGDWDYITAHGNDLHSTSELGEDYDLFWQNLALLTGRTYDVAHKERVHWSCSC
jgi:hypothetical protein